MRRGRSAMSSCSSLALQCSTRRSDQDGEDSRRSSAELPCRWPWPLERQRVDKLWRPLLAFSQGRALCFLGTQYAHRADEGTERSRARFQKHFFLTQSGQKKSPARNQRLAEHCAVCGRGFFTQRASFAPILR